MTQGGVHHSLFAEPLDLLLNEPPWSPRCIDFSATTAPRHGVGGSKAFKRSPVNVAFIPARAISAPTSGLCRVTQQPGGTHRLVNFYSALNMQLQLSPGNLPAPSLHTKEIIR